MGKSAFLLDNEKWTHKKRTLPDASDCERRETKKAHAVTRLVSVTILQRLATTCSEENNSPSSQSQLRSWRSNLKSRCKVKVCWGSGHVRQCKLLLVVLRVGSTLCVEEQHVRVSSYAKLLGYPSCLRTRWIHESLQEAWG